MAKINIFYYKVCRGNFGDELNITLWTKLLVGHEFIFHSHDDPDTTGGNIVDCAFYFVGTLLDHRVVKTPRKVIFGTGIGYGSKPILDNRWNIFFVRGPKTAEALGLSPDKAIADAAYLISDLGWKVSGASTGIGFLPHHDSVNNNNFWLSLCAKLGLKYIDPTASPESVAMAISGCDRIICEAMHGAIFADALRVPWCAVKTNPNINAFKWTDFCQSVGLSYRPENLPALHYNSQGLIGAVKQQVKLELAAWKLRQIRRKGRFILSDDRVFTDILARLRAELVSLRSYLAEWTNDMTEGLIKMPRLPIYTGKFYTVWDKIALASQSLRLKLKKGKD